MSQRRLKLRFYWANKTVDKFVFRNSKLLFHCHLRALKYLYETIESRGDGQSRDHFILGQAFIMLSPHFWFIWLDRIFFLHYANDSTLTLLRNSLFKNNKQNNFFHCYMQHLKWGGWGNEESFYDYTVLYELIYWAMAPPNFFLKMGQSRPLFVYFCPLLITISIIQIEKAYMVCLVFETAAAGW